MFVKKSDYALNKRDKDSLVYISVTGPALLTRDHFASEDEFMKWKHWSDSDYCDTEKAGRAFHDNCIPLDDQLDVIGAVRSIEDAMFLPLEEAEAQAKRAQWRAALVEQIKSRLTEKQFRRVWLYHVEKLTECEIAALEGVGQQRISKSLIASKKVFEEIAAQLNHRG